MGRVAFSSAVCEDIMGGGVGTGGTGPTMGAGDTGSRNVTVEETPTSFSPFSLVDCMLLSHFSFNDFIAVAFLDLAGDLDAQI